MSRVQIIDPTKDSKWDRFVEGHPFGWICHLSSWKRLLESCFSHIKGYFIALTDDNSGDIQAGLPIYQVKSWLTGNRLVSAPFATLFDPLATSPDQIEVLLGEAIRLAKDLGSSRIEIRAFQTASDIVNTDFISRIGFKHHYLDLKNSLDTVWKGFHRQSIRHKISKAMKNQILIKLAESEADLRKFYRLQLMTRKRLSLPLQPYKYFASMWHNFQPSGRLCLLLALRNNIPMAGLIFFLFKKKASAEFLATDNTFLNFYPNHILYWEAIKIAHQKGCGIFDFGRTSILNKGLLAFKEKWGTNIIDLPTFYYPPEIERKSDLGESDLKYQAISLICRITPKSMQRILGDYVYRHMG